SASKFTSLAGVSFPVAATVLHKLPLLSGFQSRQPTMKCGDPSYAVIGGIVHLSGCLYKTSIDANLEFIFLPAVARPVHNLWIHLFGGGGAVGTLMINTNGIMNTESDFLSVANNEIALAGISYPKNS